MISWHITNSLFTTEFAAETMHLLLELFNGFNQIEIVKVERLCRTSELRTKVSIFLVSENLRALFGFPNRSVVYFIE